MFVDRELQLKILEALKNFYPDRRSPKAWEDKIFDHQPTEEDKAKRQFNCWYLEEHGLIEIFMFKRIDKEGEFTGHCKITAKGIDFLADDGGLSAILNTVTVKFDADNIRSLIELGLLQSNIPEEKKSIFRKALSSASSTTLQTITSGLIQAAMADPTKVLKTVASILGISL